MIFRGTPPALARSNRLPSGPSGGPVISNTSSPWRRIRSSQQSKVFSCAAEDHSRDDVGDTHGPASIPPGRLSRNRSFSPLSYPFPADNDNREGTTLGLPAAMQTGSSRKRRAQWRKRGLIAGLHPNRGRAGGFDSPNSPRQTDLLAAPVGPSELDHYERVVRTTDLLCVGVCTGAGLYLCTSWGETCCSPVSPETMLLAEIMVL